MTALIGALGLLILVPPGVAAAGEDLRMLAPNRAAVGSREVTLAGVGPSRTCSHEAEQSIAKSIEGRQGYFETLAQLPQDVGFVVLSEGGTVNEIVLEAGCATFNGTGLPDGNRYRTAMEQAWRRRQSASDVASAPVNRQPAATPAASPTTVQGGWTGLAKWTGSADATTQPITVTSSELRVLTLGIPSAKVAGQLTIVVHDESGPIQTITSPPLTTKRMDVTLVKTKPGSRVRFVIAGSDVLWGVWAEER
jgi:hypothetical protein